jgi:hypothetical protein
MVEERGTPPGYQKPPSYRESTKNYIPPPTYSSSETFERLTAVQHQARTTPNNNSSRNLVQEYDNQIYQQLSRVVETTDFHSIDDYDFGQLDAALEGIDLSSTTEDR